MIDFDLPTTAAMATQNQLQQAIEEGDKRTFARLIHDGVDVNMRLTVDGDTLLFKAIREDQEGLYHSQQRRI